MFRLRTAFATLVLILGLGSAGHAQMYGGFGFGQNGFSGGFQPGFAGQQFGGVNPTLGSAYSYGNASGYDGSYNQTSGLQQTPSIQTFGAFPPSWPQTYNSMGPLLNSIKKSASRRDSWRR